MKAKKGDKVTVKYTGKLDDGSEFDSSDKHDKPLQFVVGAGQVVPGFDAAVEGMEKGEKKNVTIEPEKAYGNYNDQLKQSVPKEQLKHLPEVKEGMVLGVQLPNGQQAPAKVVAVSDEQVVIDLNHPLAGQTLHFDLEISDVEEQAAKVVDE